MKIYRFFSRERRYFYLKDTPLLLGSFTNLPYRVVVVVDRLNENKFLLFKNVVCNYAKLGVLPEQTKSRGVSF